MATVAQKPRAGKPKAAPAPAPSPAAAEGFRQAVRAEVARLQGTPVPEPNGRIEEGWQPGGKARPAEPVAPAAPAAKAAPDGPAVRHGTLRFGVQIGGNEYRLAPARAPAPVEGCVSLRKLGSEPPAGPTVYVVATDGLDIHCTCPDHVHNKSICKHIMAMVAAARILAPFAHAAQGGGL
jgi:SWIM zinc finger